MAGQTPGRKLRFLLNERKISGIDAAQTASNTGQEVLTLMDWAESVSRVLEEETWSRLLSCDNSVTLVFRKVSSGARVAAGILSPAEIEDDELYQELDEFVLTGEF